MVASLKSLCDMLREHSRSFPRQSSDSMPTTATEEPEVHMPLVNAITTLLSAIDKVSLAAARQKLLNSLEVSVLASEHEICS